MASTLRIAIALPVVAGLLTLLGTIKQHYWAATWGLDPALLGASRWGDALLASWFPAQMTVLFGLLLWVAVRTRLRWVAVVTVLHGLLPIAAHYAFTLPDGPFARGLIDGRHGALKLVPFAVIAIVWLGHPDRRARLTAPAFRPPAFGRALFWVVLVSWGISTAKHSGSYDALLAMRRPDSLLPRLVAPVPPGALGSEWYVVAAGPVAIAVWDRAAGDAIRLLVLPRPDDGAVELERPAALQPGRQYL